MTLTTFDGAPVQKPFAWSFSQLNSYRICANKYYHQTVLKDYPEPPNDNMKWGNTVHDAMAKRIAHSTPLPVGMEQWEHWAEWAMAPNGRSDGTMIWSELRMAITEQMQRCAYFEKTVQVWFRTVADVLKVKQNVARLIDWKTGKVPENAKAERDAHDQLAMGAFTVFIWFPAVEVVQTQFVYLQHNVKDERTYTRKDMSSIMMSSLPDVMKLKAALASGDFPPSPSGLCKKHCGVVSCAYYKRGAY